MQEIKFISYLPPCWIRGWLYVLARRLRSRRVNIARRRRHQEGGLGGAMQQYCVVENLYQANTYSSQ